MTNINNIIDRIRSSRSICKAIMEGIPEVYVSKQYLSHSSEYIYTNKLFLWKPLMSSIYYLINIESKYV